MKKVKPLLFLSLALTFASCDDEQPNDRVQTKDISKDGAIETQLSVEHLDTEHDIMVTTHKVWKQNMMLNEIVYRDTVPALGILKDEETGKDVQKDYEFYITVK